MTLHVSSDRRISRVRASHTPISRWQLEPLEPRTLFSAAPQPTPADLVAQADNAFAVDLYHQLSRGNSGNLFFSPYSIATALEMTLQGARGTTADEMIQAMHLPGSDLAQAGIAALRQLFQADPATAGYTLSTVNQLWVQQNFALLDSFVTSSQNLFGASPQSVDFSNPSAAADNINAWVAGQTHGKIKDLISPDAINHLTRLVLTNAIYFKGNWTSAFDSTSTHDAPFALSSSHSESVRMMQQTSDLGYYEQSGPDGFQAVDLPFQGNHLDMIVILPASGAVDHFESSLTPELFSQITSHLSTSYVNIDLPSFKLNESFDLAAPLQALGIHTAFSQAADFSGIAQAQLHISEVVHKSFIDVNENGAEAAAATGILTKISAVVMQPNPVSFNADHPFLFAIRDRATDTMLFLGRVNDPAAAAPYSPPTPPIHQARPIPAPSHPLPPSRRRRRTPSRPPMKPRVQLSPAPVAAFARIFTFDFAGRAARRLHVQRVTAIKSAARK